MTPGKYSYLVVARDFANKSGVSYDESFNFIVINGESKNDNILSYFYISSLIIGLIGTFIFILHRTVQKKIAKKRDWEITAIRIRKKERKDKIRKKK